MEDFESVWTVESLRRLVQDERIQVQAEAGKFVARTRKRTADGSHANDIARSLELMKDHFGEEPIYVHFLSTDFIQTRLVRGLVRCYAFEL
jgi:hypothetical protein